MSQTAKLAVVSFALIQVEVSLMRTTESYA